MSRTNKLGLFVLVAALAGASWIYFRKNATQTGFDRSKNVLPAEMVTVLKNGEKFEILSLNPTPASLLEKEGERVGETFHNYVVLGKTQIVDPKEREALLEALQKGIADSDGSMALCFNPRHGISATFGNKKTELVICFECLSMETHTAKGRGNGLTTTRSPQEQFDRSLEKAGIARMRREEGEKEESQNPGFE